MNMNRGNGEFPVQFFGSHDYNWIHRGRAFHYMEGDNKRTPQSGGSKSLGKVFKLALEEAKEEYKKWQQHTEKTLQLKKPVPPHYVRIRSNKPVGKVQQQQGDDESHSKCDCDPESETRPCSSDTDCLNRLLMFECNPGICPANEKCCNRRFKKREYVKAAPFSTAGRGWGLKALEDIKKGQFVVEYVGELIDEEECERRLNEMVSNNQTNFYFLTIDKERIVDAGPKGNLARFMNHSCQPNCETQKWMVNGQTRVGLFAVCDIPEGSELTFNYNLDCRGNEKTRCGCGAKNCSGFIGVRPNKATSEESSGRRMSNGSVKKKRQYKERKPRVSVSTPSNSTTVSTAQEDE
jgi:histone-lysine N-methyltransferase NSD2